MKGMNSRKTVITKIARIKLKVTNTSLDHPRRKPMKAKTITKTQNNVFSAIMPDHSFGARLQRGQPARAVIRRCAPTPGAAPTRPWQCSSAANAVYFASGQSGYRPEKLASARPAESQLRRAVANKLRSYAADAPSAEWAPTPQEA